MAIADQCGEKSGDGSSALVAGRMNSSPDVEKYESVDASTGRRSSSRLSGKTRTFYGIQKTPPQSDKTAVRKKAKNYHSEQVSMAPQNPQKLTDSCTDQHVIVCENTDVVNCHDGKSSRDPLESNEQAVSVDPHAGMHKTAHIRVKETLRLFNTHYLHFIQEEEKRSRQVEAKVPNPKNKEKRSRKADVKVSKAKVAEGEGNARRASKRPDLKAITKMIQDKTILYPVKRIGHLPGIDVGHQFFSRAEMVVLGIHGHWLNGIDYMGLPFSKLAEYKDYKLPMAVCIVLSGMYEDDLDNSEDVVYTGQGGHDLLGSKHQIKDQQMVRGNLALKNSIENNQPVRVVRGHGSTNSYCGRVYTYDGLYQVVNYWAEKGVSGFTVYKYRLKRLDGQPVLTTNQVLFTRAQAPKSLSELRGLVAEDISGGQENIPIPATNTVDDPPVAPTDYVYHKSVQVSSNVKLPISDVGCNCKGDCVDPRTCSCARLNGSDFPYVRKDGGRLIEAKAVLFECGPNCTCGPSCVNRTSQQGLKYRLEVFRTAKKGWAIRSWDTIPSGAPICEYTGVLMRTDEVENALDNNYIFDIDCLQTMKGLDGRERRPGDVSALVKDTEKLEVPEFCIDAGHVGNVARFINHSCQPNLFVQCILSSHHDIKLAKVMLFAADTIPPLQELSYDYGYVLDSVIGPDGKIKKVPCYCGALDCRKRLY